MKLARVFEKERERNGISIADTARSLGMPEDAYRQLENGHSAVEKWGTVLAKAALKLKTPTARLISESGMAVGIKNGNCGKLLRHFREETHASPEEMAAAVGVSTTEYEEIERGDSQLEFFGPILLRFAELVEQPVYNLLFPCGVSIEKLEDY